MIITINSPINMARIVRISNMMVLLVILCSLVMQVLSRGEDFPMCGSCWCVPDNNGTAACPSDSPVMYFSDTVINVYKSQIPQEIMKLNCNPYTSSGCSTTPAQSLLNVSSAVCAVRYASNVDGSTSCSSYSLETFPSEADAVAAGLVVTHAGSCGVCSTMQDLAIYLIEDFTAAGKVCATKGLFNEAAGLECYKAIGLTEECAKIWNYDGIYDGKACGATCAQHVSDPNNGPAPACELNPCLQCDEDKAGPLFTQFAGRTRRRSGLLSEIVRPCSSIARLTHNPCENPACGC